MADSGRTEEHAAVVEEVAEMFKHSALIDTPSATEVAQETTARDHHVRRRVLYTDNTGIGYTRRTGAVT